MGVLGLYDAVNYFFALTLQGVVAMGLVAAITSPYPAMPAGRVDTLSLLYPRFACGVAGDGDLPPIWEAVVQGKGRTEGPDTLNWKLMRGSPLCCWSFGDRMHFSAPPPCLR